MDAFSIAVSVGLQYGVPLEDYASKFINMKFEPSGHDERPGHPVRVVASSTTCSGGWRSTT